MEKAIGTVGSSTYQAIKRDIIFGALSPGTKLKLGQLKDLYDASLSTLRETLSRLSSEGFVAAEQQRGFFVTPVSREDLIEISNLRVLLECHALELSINQGDADWEGNLVAAHHKLRFVEDRLLAGDFSDKEVWKRYDWEFHLALIQACNSQNLLSLHAVLFDKYLRYQMLVLTYRGEEAMDEHKEIFETALARKTSEAKEALKRHIVKGLEHTIKSLN